MLLLLRPAGVVAGAVAGHGIATVVAVLGGSFLGKYLDEKVVQYVGGSLFLVSPPSAAAALQCHCIARTCLQLMPAAHTKSRHAAGACLRLQPL